MNKQRFASNELVEHIPAGTFIPNSDPRNPLHDRVYEAGGFTQPMRGGALVSYPEDQKAVAATRAKLVGRLPVSHSGDTIKYGE